MATATKKKSKPDPGGLGGHSAWTSKIVGHDRVDPNSLVANPHNFRRHRDRPSSSTDHPTMKPVKLFAYQIANSTAPQGLTYDSCSGSGTTIIAAEQLGRRCFAMEISPAYCDVAVARWERLTGKKAELSH